MTELSKVSAQFLYTQVCAFLAQEGVEGLRLKAYLCSAGKPTIGIGLTVYPDGSKVKIGDTCTREQAYAWCQIFLEKNVVPVVGKYRKVIPDLETYVSLCSFVYNYRGKLGDSLIAALKKPALDKKELAAAFTLYDKFTNPETKKLEVSVGLKNRRKLEVKNFMI